MGFITLLLAFISIEIAIFLFLQVNKINALEGIRLELNNIATVMGSLYNLKQRQHNDHIANKQRAYKNEY